MERRKFVIGAGALATGSAAAMGTGAFSSVEANRQVSVNVANDENAYLGIEPASGATFADTDGDGVVELNFNSDSNASGNGLNANADTGFGPELQFSNQGTDDILVTIDTSDVDDAISGNLSFFLDSESVGKEASLKQNDGPKSGGNQGVILESGSSVKVSGLFRDIDASDISEGIGGQDITVYAVSDDSERFPDAGPSTAGSHVPTISSED